MKPVKEKAITKRLVFCHGDKGGVGKSTFARVLAEWYTFNQIPWAGFDTDATNGHLFRFYPDRTKAIVLKEDGNIDQILDAVDSGNSILLVDLGARTGDVIHEWCRDTDLFSIMEGIGLAITVCFLLDPIKDSTSLLRNVADLFGGHSSYVLVKNQANGLRFDLYDNSRTRARLMEELRGVEITIPELLSTTYYQVDQLNLSWDEATRHPGLQLAARQRVKGFLRQCFAQIEPVAGHLRV